MWETESDKISSTSLSNITVAWRVKSTSQKSEEQVAEHTQPSQWHWIQMDKSNGGEKKVNLRVFIRYANHKTMDS